MPEVAEKPVQTWKVTKEGYIAIPRAEFLRVWHDETEGEEYVQYAIAVGPPPVRESILREDETTTTVGDYLHQTAMDYLRSLLPRLGTDVGLENFRRTAFTLAVATEKTVLEKVQGVLWDVLRTGAGAGVPAEAGLPREPKAWELVQAALGAAGLRDDAPYAKMVTRTNLMDTYNEGYQSQALKSRLFPVFMYSNPDDSRSRPHHAAKNGLYYPADVPFRQVRGESIEDAASCRCLPIFLDAWTWQERKAAGARIADGYADVPGEIPLPRDRVAVAS